MSEKNSYSKLAIPTVLVTLISLVAFIANSESIGLTLVFFAILLLAGTFVKNRLTIIGAETWALGSVIVWFGFFLIAIPLVAFAWGFMSSTSQYITFFAGLILIILGFTTEFFDLNEKFLEWIKRTNVRLKFAWGRFKKRTLSSIFAKIQFSLTILLLISFIFSSVTSSVENSLPDTLWLHPRMIILYLMFITFLFQIRELLVTFFVALAGFVAIFFRGIVRRIRLLPDLLQRFWGLILGWLHSLFIKLKLLMRFVWRNSQVTGMFGFVVFGSISLIRDDKTIFAIAVLLLLGAMAVLIKRNPEFVTRQLNRVQQSTYRRSLRVQNRFRTPKEVSCPQCGVTLSKHHQICYNCATHLPNCSVCRMPIFGGSLVLDCMKCKQQGHEDHLKGWFRYGGRNPTCPHCREIWEFN